MNKDFLQEMLETASPSGLEMEIQKKWRDYVKVFAHEVKSDHIGNVYGILNPEMDFKILLAGHVDEIGFMVSAITEDGFIKFTKVGSINPKISVGMKLKILTSSGEEIKGVFGVNAEHHGGVKENLEITDIFLDCGFKNKENALNKVSIGDLAVYDVLPMDLNNNMLSGRGLDNRTGSFIVAEVLKRLSIMDLKIGVYGVSSVNEETNLGGAYFAGSIVKPDMAIATDVTFATDYPGVDKIKHGDIKLGGGPVLAKGAPINIKINRALEETAKELEMNIQYELTPGRTGTDADMIRKTGNGVPIALVSLPLRYMHSPCETASYDDIEDEINLLVNMIKKLDKDFNLNPLD